MANKINDQTYKELIRETRDFAGQVLWALYNDPNQMALTGQALIGAELAASSASKTRVAVSRRLIATCSTSTHTSRRHT